MMKFVAPFVFLTFSVSIFAQNNNDLGKISGSFFFDYYDTPKHHDPTIEGRNGFWFRRIYLTFDRKQDENVSVRLRLEAKSPGDFTSGGSMDPFFKDAFVRFTKNGHQFTAGLSPTPTFDSTESNLGYRAMERTPMDLYRLENSRDTGISAQGPIDREGKFRYFVMAGTGSGTKSSTDNTRAFYGSLTYRPCTELTLDLYGDHWSRPGDTDWNTWKLEGQYVAPRVRIGAIYAQQTRRMAGAPSVTVGLRSLYAETQLGRDWHPFGRIDVLTEPVPSADKIDYLVLSKAAKPTLYMGGVRYAVTKDLEVAPVIILVHYAQPGAGARPADDMFIRFTVHLKF